MVCQTNTSIAYQQTYQFSRPNASSTSVFVNNLYPSSVIVATSILLQLIGSFITCFNVDSDTLIPSCKVKFYQSLNPCTITGLYRSFNISVAPSQPDPILTALYSVYVPEVSVKNLHSHSISIPTIDNHTSLYILQSKEQLQMDETTCH